MDIPVTRLVPELSFLQDIARSSGRHKIRTLLHVLGARVHSGMFAVILFRSHTGSTFHSLCHGRSGRLLLVDSHPEELTIVRCRL